MTHSYSRILPPAARLVAAAALLTLAASGRASVSIYTGYDLSPNSTTLPTPTNSNAAAAQFYAAAGAIGTVSTISFESTSLGAFTNLTIAPGVSMTAAPAGSGVDSILNTSNSPSFIALDGYNTTPGGANFVEVQAGTLTYNFVQPVQFFGLYLSGVQTYFFQDVITFSDGSSQTINVPGSGTSGSIGATDFVGFTDPGSSISSITLTASTPGGGADYIGADDVSYGRAAAITTGATPEPGSFMLLLSGLGGVTAVWRRTRNLTV